jgi:predicted transposase/invertase (TIGR01784 family)
MELHKSHDKFFKEVFSNIEEAIDLIKNTIPENVLDKIDLDTLQLDNASYTDKKLKEHFSDLVFNCEYGEGKIKVAFLFEHKSYVPSYPHLQVLNYMIKIWEMNIKEKSALMPVIPIIVYHGKENWEEEKFSDYFPGIDAYLLPFFPNFEYILENLPTVDFNKILESYQSPVAKLALAFLKYIFMSDELTKLLPDLFFALENFKFDSKIKDFIVSFTIYLANNSDIEVDEIVRSLEKVNTEGGQIAMTTAEKLINQGKTEGKIEGKIENLKQNIINIYQKLKLEPQQIANILETSEQFVIETLEEKGIL